MVLTRPIVYPPALISWCVATSPARMRRTNVGRLKPLTNMAVSVAPNGVLASNRSARRWCAPRRRFLGAPTSEATGRTTQANRSTKKPIQSFCQWGAGAPETEMRDFSPASGFGVGAHSLRRHRHSPSICHILTMRNFVNCDRLATANLSVFHYNFVMRQLKSYDSPDFWGEG